MPNLTVTVIDRHSICVVMGMTERLVIIGT